MPETLRCISPIDGTIVAERTALTFNNASVAIALARNVQRDWAALPLADRIRTVMAGVAALGGMNDEIVPELARQMGRPVRYGGEFAGVDERARFMAGVAPKVLATREIETSDRFLRRITLEPQGVILVIAPWNYPFLTAINSIVPALIAGNAVLLKHATQTLLAGERMAAAFHGAGVPEHVFQNVVLTHDVTSELIANRGFAHVHFTGSVEGGRAIGRAAAGTFTAVSTELGGKDPGYVMEDADIEAAATNLIDGAMFNSGQSCCAIERIYVHQRHFDSFVDKAREIVRDYRLGNPLDAETTLGPMAHIRFADVARAQIDEAIAKGATPLINKADFPADEGGPYLAPQILIDVNQNMRIMQDETFGPAVGIMAVEDDDEALALMNDSRFGLTASLWSADCERAAEFGARIETGTVFANRADYLDPALCWSGRKDTGHGISLSEQGYLSVTRPKSYHLKR